MHKPKVACKFHFIVYFYLPLKSCNFNYSSYLLLNKQFCRYKTLSSPTLQPHQWYLLKLTTDVKAKYLYEVKLFLYSIGYLDHSVHPPLQICWGVKPSTKFSKGDLTGSQFLETVAREERSNPFQEGSWSFYIKRKLKSEILNDKRSL